MTSERPEEKMKEKKGTKEDEKKAWMANNKAKRECQDNMDGTITGEPTLDVLELATQRGAFEVNSMNKGAERVWEVVLVVVG